MHRVRRCTALPTARFSSACGDPCSDLRSLRGRRVGQLFGSGTLRAPHRSSPLLRAAPALRALLLCSLRQLGSCAE